MPYKDLKSPEAIKSRNECALRYYYKNKEEIAEKNKDPKRIKALRISRWKGRGVIGNYDELYDKYINAECCEKCNKKFNDENNNDKRCLDHNHETGEFRNILCMYCNRQLKFLEYKDKYDKQKLETKEKEKQKRKEDYAKLDKEEKKKKDAEYYEANKERIKERVRLHKLKKKENPI
jgi:hypothetical protein